MSLGDLSVLIAAGSLLVGVIGTAFAFWRWVASTLRASEATAAAAVKAAEAEANTQRVILQTQIDLVRSQLSEFKLDVAKNYASGDRLQEMEAKLTANLDRLINRFEAFATDFNRLVGRMERADQAAGR